MNKDRGEEMIMQVPGLYFGRKDAKRQDASAEGGPESSRRNRKGHIYN